MDISSVTSSPAYNSTVSSSQSSDENGADETGNADDNATDVPAIISAIEGAASSNNSLSMLDALKLIGGSGSANVAALVHVAESTITESADQSLVNSIGNTNPDDIFTVVQKEYAAAGNLSLYQMQTA